MSFFFKTPPKPSTDQIVRSLDSEGKYIQALQHIKTFGRLPQNMHGNTYLHHAIVWGCLDAAIYILTICKKSRMNIHDTFDSSQSTPLVLAAKTAANKVAMLLIGMGADLNQSDHLGYTALHYACLMRNEALIEALIASGAKVSIINEHKMTPLDYYLMEIDESDLEYKYRVNADDKLLLKRVSDWNKTYVGTNNKHLSAFRWFISNIIVNLDIGHGQILDHIAPDQDSLRMLYMDDICLNVELSEEDIFFWMKKHLDLRTPVGDTRLYQGGMKAIVTWRKSIEENTVRMLTSGKCDTTSLVRFSS